MSRNKNLKTFSVFAESLWCRQEGERAIWNYSAISLGGESCSCLREHWNLEHLKILFPVWMQGSYLRQQAIVLSQLAFYSNIFSNIRGFLKKKHSAYRTFSVENIGFKIKGKILANWIAIINAKINLEFWYTSRKKSILNFCISEIFLLVESFE